MCPQNFGEAQGIGSQVSRVGDRSTAETATGTGRDDAGAHSHSQHGKDLLSVKGILS